MSEETNLNNVYIIISCITLAAAILCPVLKAWINNHHQLKLKQLEIEAAAARSQSKHKQDIIENYLMSAGACIENPSYENLASYCSYYALAFQYMPEDLHPQMKNLNVDLADGVSKSAIDEYEKLALMMQEHTKQSLKN